MFDQCTCRNQYGKHNQHETAAGQSGWGLRQAGRSSGKFDQEGLFLVFVQVNLEWGN